MKMKKIKIKILKKSQVVVSAIAFMFIAAGYLNYTSNLSKEISAKQSLEKFDYAGIGDAKLVDSELVEEKNINDGIVTEGALVSNDKPIDDENKNKKEDNVYIQTNAQEDKSDDYFVTSKLERDKMYSQMLETYQKILDNTNIPQDQKSISSQEITNINNTKNAIMIAENLIKNKGFEDTIIFVNDKSVSVVVKAEKIEQNQIAQIQNIISRELNVEISNIHISNK